MDDSTVSKIDDLWVQYFTKSLSALTGQTEENLRKGVGDFQKVAVKVGEENLKKGPVTQFKIEAAGGGKLMLATANLPVRVKVSALNAGGVAVADFTGKVKLSANKTLTTDPLETPAFVAGVLDNIELKFKLPNSKVTLTAAGDGITTESESFAWAENPKWPQGGVPSKVDDKKSTDPEVKAALETEVLEAVNGGTLATKITDPSFRKGLMDFLDKPDAVDEGMGKKLLAGFRQAPETDSELREKIFKKAFACKLNATLDGKRGAVPPKVLTKMVDILETLPRDHLPANWDLSGASGTSKTSGSWDPDNKKATFDYGADDAPAFDQAYDNAQPGDALDGTKCFDVMVRHEVGHAVHSDKGGEALTDSANGGAWKRHGAFANVLDAFVGLIGDFASTFQTVFSLPAKPEANVIKEKIGGLSQDSLKEADKFKKALGLAFVSLPGIPFPSTVTGLQKRQEYVAERLPMDHELLKVIFQGARLTPYFELGSSPITVGGLVYLNAENADGWVSFDAASYANKISIYQYRSPSEWFAEFYAGVNNGDQSVRKKVAGKYPAAHGWMKSNHLLLYPNE